MAERLTKAERVQKRADFLRIQGSGRKIHTPSFICFSVASTRSGGPSGAADTEQPTRIGITVSRRVGGAVVRNRVKRLIREAYRRQKAAFGSSLELVVIARPEAGKVAYAQVFAELHEASRRIGASAPFKKAARSRSQ